MSPPLTFELIPPDAVELAVVVTNADDNNAIHWIVTGIDPATPGFDEGSIPQEAEEQSSHFEGSAWVGPNTPAETNHRYLFTLYALTESLEFSSDFDTNSTLSLIQQRAIPAGTATIMGSHQG